ncbi:zinc finger protein 564-like [Amphibalanus amphitrite]|uniref:zinc finger protein 564-like n=1 Tax=Amphibalanus amphitrite TaxID=1232801 RepID=UPI001C8FCB73|nr:zinc finger protein 564-like [Amphibalanus amphitrite]
MMEEVGGEPCPSHLGPSAVAEDHELTEPTPSLADCSPLKSLGPTLHSLLLADTHLPAKRSELGLTDVHYLEPLPLATVAAPVAPEPTAQQAPAGCSVIMGYLSKPDEPGGQSQMSVSTDTEDPDDPAALPPALPDLSQTCLVCGVTAERGRARCLRTAEPLPASGSAYLSFVGALLSAELEPGALDRLEVICPDCHDLLVTIDDLEQRVAAMKNSVRSQFREWWRAAADDAAGAGPELRRRGRRAAAAGAGRRPGPQPDVRGTVTEADPAADDEFRPSKRRKNAPKSGARRAKSGMASERKIAKSKNLVCTRCPFYTFDRDALRAHIASVHAGEKVHSCEVCHKRFTYEDSLKRHMNQHQHFIKEFRCQPCGEQFVNRSELLLHRQLYLHGAQGSPPPPEEPAAAEADCALQFACPDCGLVHTLRDSEQQPRPPACQCGRQMDIASVLRLFPNGGGNGACLACHQSCDGPDAMERHLAEVHGAGDVVCSLCGSRFAHLDHFQLHALFHSTLEEFACEQCPFRTYSPARFASHRHEPAPAAERPVSDEAIVAAVRNNPPGRRGRPRKDAPPEPPAFHRCPICSKELSSLTNLKNHMVLHSDVHEHKCPVCGRRFKLRKYLNTHLTLHTGVRQFKCTVCGKDFNQKCELNRHMRYHNGDMTHVCEFCGKRFREANGLKFHLQTHTGERPFSCDQCGKALRSASKLRVHQRTHTGEKPYKCEYCGKDFAYKYNFDCHLRLHTGDRRFRCSVCQTGFERRDKLKAHEQSCPPPPPASEPHPYPWSMEALEPH